MKIESKMRLYSPPANRSQKCIEFSWAEILRNKKSDLCITREKPPSLYLDDLRTELEEGVEFYFNLENGDSDDDDSDEEML